MRIVLLAAALAAVVSCAQKPPSPPRPPLNSAADCESACINLGRLGCPESKGAISGESCARRCLVASELRSLPVACWTSADSAAEARACGSLRCDQR
jgi:hypothetical protein